jgi:hypothetical protein
MKIYSRPWLKDGCWIITEVSHDNDVAIYAYPTEEAAREAFEKLIVRHVTEDGTEGIRGELEPEGT